MPRVRRHVVELRRRLVVQRRPRHAAVEAHARAPVVAVDHPTRVLRVDPQVVAVAVRHRHAGERPPPVRRHVGRALQHPDRVRVLRVREDVRVVPRPSPQRSVVARPLPRRPAVVRAVHAALLRLLHHRVHPAGARRRDDDAQPPQRARWQAGVARDLRPRVPPVRRPVEAAVRPAAFQRPGGAPRLVDGGEQHARVVRVQRQVDGAGVLAAEEHLLPVLPPVPRPIHAALLVRPKRVAQRGRVHGVRVLGVHADAGDVPGLRQAHVRPRPAGVRRLVDAVAPVDVLPDVRLAHADVDHVPVRRRNGDGPHGGAVEEAVRHVPPVGAPVVRLPHPAGARAKVEGHRVFRVTGHGAHASAPVRPNEPPFERVEESCVHCCHDHPPGV